MSSLLLTMLPDLSDRAFSAASGPTEPSSDASDHSEQGKLPITPETEDMTQSLSDRILQAFFTEALDAMVITDDAGRYVEANPAACELFGLPKEALLGRCIADFSLVSIDMQAAWQTFREQGHERGTFSLVRADGVIREVEYAATADFTPHHHLSILRDVTERNQLARELQTLNQTLEQQVAERTVELQQANAELYRVNQRLQIAHDRYDWVIRSIGEGLWDWDIRSNQAVVSDRYWQILGYDPQQMGNETLETSLSRTHPDDIPRIQQALEQHLRHRQPYVMEYRVQHPAGYYIWIRSRGQAIWDEHGNPVRMVGTIEDISERKAAELALSQQEREFRTLAENSPDCIMRCDRQFRFLYVNSATAALTGLPKHLFLGKTSEELGFPDALVTYWHEAMTQVFTTGQDISLEYTMLFPAGEHTMSSRVVPERDSHGAVISVLIVARDITDLKRAQQMLLVQAEQERILSTIVHHIRQSLDLDQILDAAVHDVHHLLQADRVLVYRFNPDGSGNMIAEAVSKPWISLLGSNLRDPCFADKLAIAYYQGKIYQVHDLQATSLPACYQELLAGYQVRASLAVPIIIETELWGLFCIHYCAAPHHWQPWETELLQRLTEQVAIAIHQANLYDRLQQINFTLEQQVLDRTHQLLIRTTELEQALQAEQLLRRITDRVRDSLNEDYILDAVVRELGQGLALECCDTGIYNEDLTTSTITHEFTRSLVPAKNAQFPITEFSHADIYRQLFQGQSIQFCEVSGDYIRPDLQYLTILACPIRDDQRVLGDLWLFKPVGSVFSEAELRLVEQVANQCAIALRQSRLYQAAQAQVTELERLNRLKDDFLSTVSHELRTPMSNIKMATELLELHLKQLGILPSVPGSTASSLPVTRYFQILKDEGDREITLINDLLDLARLDANTEPLVLLSIDLNTWIPSLLETFVARAQAQQQSLIIQLPADLPVMTTDAIYLQRVLTELMNNACKYTPTGERIWVSAMAMATTIELRVGNSGVDISDMECDRIFDRFYRIPNHDPWKHGGTGLGLALVKKLVDYLQGTIYAEASARQLQFVIRLPIHLSLPSESTCT